MHKEYIAGTFSQPALEKLGLTKLQLFKQIPD